MKAGQDCPELKAVVSIIPAEPNWIAEKASVEIYQLPFDSAVKSGV